MSILLKLAQVSDVLALLQPIQRLQDLHLNLHRFPLKTKHYLRLLGLEQEWNGRKLSLSSPPTGKEGDKPCGLIDAHPKPLHVKHCVTSFTEWTQFCRLKLESR
ncbi:unnamed protein product [Sphenostylis stenocarpa]|uniref:Uncharacterized protein n=1 Tax=Sphenostylis stenocarpa TaxID=92480 RepID=A0AA86VNE9_9FABA|nr:unnamed protein product [Sphenostylis stenocarpa]